MRRRYAALAAALALALPVALGGCTAGRSGEGGAAPARPPATVGGSAERPTVVEAATGLLDWRPVEGPTTQLVTTNGEWTLTVDDSRREARLAGPTGPPQRLSAAGTQVSDALMSQTHAVVVLQDRQEVRPSRAVVVDLSTGRRTEVHGRSEVPTTPGGTWALGPDTLVHATFQGRDYCLATVDLATGSSARGWCAPPRHGFSGARVTAQGVAIQTFDDSRPSCRTVGTVTGTTFEPLVGPPDCKAWDAVLLPGGAVWSVVPKQNNVESARLYARSGEGYADLGPGTSGTLTACGGAAYFVRDPQRPGEPARLLRWDGAELTVVYESPGGEAFVEEPRCGGDVLTLTALAEGGDEQVSAPVG